MGKSKNPELENEQIVEDEPIIVKGPLRDDPAPVYSPAWEVVNDRQNILTDKIPPKIMSLDALIAAGVVNETNLATYLEDNGYVKNTDYAASGTGGVIKTGGGYGAWVTGAGVIAASARTAEQYPSDGLSMFIAKGTLENIKLGYVAEALVGIAAAQFPEATAGTYTVKLTYDGAGWGVTIIQDT